MHGMCHHCKRVSNKYPYVCMWRVSDERAKIKKMQRGGFSFRSCAEIEE